MKNKTMNKETKNETSTYFIRESTYDVTLTFLARLLPYTAVIIPANGISIVHPIKGYAYPHKVRCACSKYCPSPKKKIKTIIFKIVLSCLDHSMNDFNALFRIQYFVIFHFQYGFKICSILFRLFTFFNQLLCLKLSPLWNNTILILCSFEFL